MLPNARGKVSDSRGKIAGSSSSFGGPLFQYEINNLTGTPSNSTPGANFTYGGGNVDGAAVSVLTPAQALQYLVIGVGGCGTNAEDNSALADILIDTAGGTNWSTLIDDLIVGFTGGLTNGTGPMPLWYHFPLLIPAGASLGIRAKKNGATAATAGYCVMFGFGNPANPRAWDYGTGVESLGIADAANSKATLHTPGNTGAWSSYATVGTSTKTYRAIQLGLNGSDATASNSGYHWQVGVGGAQVTGVPTFYGSIGTAETMARTQFYGPTWCTIPSGTAIQVRATCSGAAEQQNVAIYGVY